MKDFRIEWIKQAKTNIIICILLPIILNLLLYIDLTFRYKGYLLLHQLEYGLTNWQLIFKEQSVFYIAEITHVFVATLIYEIYIYELKENAWNVIASTTYVDKKVTFGKATVAFVDIFIYFLTDYIMIFLIGKKIGVDGQFEIKLFVISFLVQIFSAIMMITFYIFVIYITKKVFIILPLSIGFMFANITFYYSDDVKLLFGFPFTYISYGFRSNVVELLQICVICIVLSSLFLIFAEKSLKKNHEIRR